MKHFFRGLAVALIGTCIMLMQTGCKEHTIINANVSPVGDSVSQQTWTLKVATRTYYDDSLSTSPVGSGINIYQAVGNISSNFFGNTNASTIFQVTPTTPTYVFDGTTYTLDSAVLILPYAGFMWGDSATDYTQKYTVYRMIDTLNFYTDYFPDWVVATDLANPLGSVTIHTRGLNDSVSVGGYNYSPHVRITLNSTFLDLVRANYGTGYTATNFLNACHALVVSADSTGPVSKVMPYYHLDGDITTYAGAGVMVYFHDAGGLSYTEPMYYNTSASPHYNRITRRYSAAMPGGNINDLISAGYNPASQKVALQNQPGASVDVIIYGIKSIPRTNKGNPIINRAELQLTLLSGYTNYEASLFAPYVLQPIGVANNGSHDTTYLLADSQPYYSVGIAAAIDGLLHTYTTTTGSTYQAYSINLPRELQKAMAANQDTIHLHINGDATYYGAYQAVFAAGNYSDTVQRAKVNVVYSKLK